jgi:hypothetical protein
LAITRGPIVEAGKDFLDGTVQTVHGHGPFFTGFDETTKYFFPVEGFPGAVPLDDLELGALDLFVGGVAVVTCQTNPAPARGGPILRHTGVDDFVLE